MEFLGILAPLIMAGFMLAIGLLIGGKIERTHFRRLDRSERELSGVMISNMKRLPQNWHAEQPVLVNTEVVIATDYFKTFVAGLRNLFGGRIRSYETLVERARREAVVRLKRQAQAANCNVVWNLRLSTSCIRGQDKRQPGGVEVIAYGTAMRVSERSV